MGSLAQVSGSVDVASLVGLAAELVVSVALIGLFSLFVFAELTGWRRLARRFPCVANAPRAERYASRGVVIGPFARSAPPLRVRLGPDRLTLQPAFPFSIAFGRVCIPWDAVHSTHAKKYALFEALELRYGPAETATIGFLPSDAARAIEARVASSLRQAEHVPGHESGRQT